MKRFIQVLVVIALLVFIANSLPRLKSTIRQWRITYLFNKEIERVTDFNSEKEIRYKATIKRLEDIREVQFAYKKENGFYSDNWDTLVSFLQHGSTTIIKAVGELTDSMIENRITEKKAVEMGLIIRDTQNVLVSDLLSENLEDFNNIRFIPYSDMVEFRLDTGTISLNDGRKTPVFEVKAHNNYILNGLDMQIIINLNDEARTNEKYPGLKVGSLFEFNRGRGNWE
jgi:hypothetical protein